MASGGKSLESRGGMTAAKSTSQSNKIPLQGNLAIYIGASFKTLTVGRNGKGELATEERIWGGAVR